MSRIHWFPWLHGESSDSRLRLIAHQTGCRPVDSIAVWAQILEHASATADRGSIVTLNVDLIAFTLDVDATLVGKIVAAMYDLGLLADERVVDWEKLRELRRDPTGAERGQRHRNKKREDVTLRNDTEQDRTEQDTTEHKKKQDRNPTF